MRIATHHHSGKPGHGCKLIDIRHSSRSLRFTHSRSNAVIVVGNGKQWRRKHPSCASPAARRDAANLERPLGRSLPWREILHLFHVTSYFLPATLNLRKIYRIKNKQGSFPGRTPVAGVITPSTFCEFYLQPVYRAASARFQQVLFFSAHFPGRYFERPSFFLAYDASRHLPMLRLRARFKPFDAEPCA